MSRIKEHRRRLRRRPQWVCVLCCCSLIFYSLNFYGYSLYIPYIYIPYIYVYIYIFIYIYVYILNIFHIVSFVCFLIYGVNRRKTQLKFSGRLYYLWLVGLALATGPAFATGPTLQRAKPQENQRKPCENQYSFDC